MPDFLKSLFFQISYARSYLIIMNEYLNTKPFHDVSGPKNYFKIPLMVVWASKIGFITPNFIFLSGATKYTFPNFQVKF